MGNRISKGFTIAELIIVMMIIVLLVAILLPALSSARKRAKDVARKAQLSSISAACESYSLQMRAYPGYYSDIYYTNGSARIDVTASEMMMVSLLGRVDSAATSPIHTTYSWSASGVSYGGDKIDLDAVGSGPLTKGGTSYGAFYSPKPDELALVTGTWGGSNSVPEIIDATTGVPILYYGVNANGSVPVTSGLNSSAMSGGVNRATNVDFLRSNSADNLTTADGENYDQEAMSLFSHGTGGGSSADDNLAWAITSEKLSTSPPNTSTSVIAGGFVLINAGEDGIYFSKGQNAGSQTIANYAALDDFDDIVQVGGAQ